VDQLHQDIVERVQSQGILYSQNEQLWEYLTILLKTNRTNAKVLRDRIQSLHNELHALHVERAVLINKLRDGQMCKDKLEFITVEHNSALQALSDAEDKKLAAVEALKSAEEENETLELNLQNQLGRMRHIHTQLEDLRSRKIEEDAYERAEDYYSNSHCVLRRALRRFCDQVRQSRRRSSLKASVKRVHRAWVLGMCTSLWQGFVKRRRLMHRNTARRAWEGARLCVARWKVYTALERHFKDCARRRRLSSAFCLWKEGVLAFIAERQADEFRTNLEMRRCKARVIREWKKLCVFVEWESLELRHKERVASRHFVARLLHHWRLISDISADELADRASRVRFGSRLLRRPFQAWRTLGICHSLRRAMMLRRVFRNIEWLRARREKHDSLLRRAALESLRIRGRACLRRMRVHARNKAKYFATVKQLQSVGNPRSWSSMELCRNMRRRKIFGCLLTWAQRLAKWKHQTICCKVAKRHMSIRQKQRYLTLWYRNTCEARKILVKANQDLTRLVFDHWCLFVPQEKREKRLEMVVERKYQVAVESTRVKLLRRWRKRARKTRLLKIMEYQCLRRVRMWSLRLHYTFWRDKWVTELVFREKEAQVDAKRNMSLVELKTLELEDSVREREELLSSLREVNEALDKMREAVKKKDDQISGFAATLSNREEELQSAESTLRETKEQLEDCVAERNRLRVLEDVFERDKEFESARQKSIQEDAESTLLKLEMETSELRQEINDAKRLSSATQSTLASELHQDEEFLGSTVQAASALHSMVVDKQREIADMENNRDSLLEAISKVKSRLQSTTREVFEAEDERLREVRQKTSEIHILRSKTRLAESRVDALRETVRVRREALNAKKTAQLLNSDDRELASVQGMIELEGERSPKLRSYDMYTYENGLSSRPRSTSVPSTSPTIPGWVSSWDNSRARITGNTHSTGRHRECSYAHPSPSSRTGALSVSELRTKSFAANDTRASSPSVSVDALSNGSSTGLAIEADVEYEEISERVRGLSTRLHRRVSHISNKEV